MRRVPATDDLGVWAWREISWGGQAKSEWSQGTAELDLGLRGSASAPPPVTHLRSVLCGLSGSTTKK